MPHPPVVESCHHGSFTTPEDRISCRHDGPTDAATVAHYSRRPRWARVPHPTRRQESCASALARPELHDATQICRPGTAPRSVRGPPHPPARPGRAPPVGEEPAGGGVCAAPARPAVGESSLSPPPPLSTRGGWVTGWAAGVGWGRVAGGGRSTARAGPVVRPLVGGGVRARVSPSAWRRHRLLPLTMGGRGPLRCGAGLWSLSWCCGQGRRQGTCALAVMKGNAPRRAAPANHAPTHRGAPRRQAQLLYCRLSRRLPDGLSCGLCHWRRP